MKKVTVFMGGTCGDSKWRDALVPMLNKEVDAFNPVVPDWNDEAYARELKARAESDFVLYTITPATDGTYSVAEVVDDSNKRPEKVLLCVLKEDCGKTLEGHQAKAMKKVAEMVVGNGANIFESLEGVAIFLNDVAEN